MDTQTNSVKTYMGEIGSFPLVNRKQEEKLAVAIADGSDDARFTLAEANLRLVVKIAHDFRNLGVPLADLIAEGNVGLMKAVAKFQSDKGAKFSSYAAWWIKQAIRRAIANQSKVVRVPVQAVAKMKLIRQTSVELANTFGYVPTDKQIAKQLGMTERSIRSTVATANASLVSMDAEIQDGESGKMGDFISDTKIGTPESIMEKSDVLNFIKNIMEKKLNLREQTIIRMRYGFDDGQPKTLEEVSNVVGRTRERVRQIQFQALKKLKLQIDDSNISSMLSFTYAS